MSGTDPLNPLASDPVAQVVAALTQRNPASPDGTGDEKRVDRNPPKPEEARAALVKHWQSEIELDKKHHAPAFKRMRMNMKFAYGKQWEQEIGSLASPNPRSDTRDPRYVANIALRHVQQRTASLYASNPTFVAERRERMLATIWDGDMATLQQAQQEMQAAAQAQTQPMMPGAPPPQPASPNALAIVTDFKNVQTYERMLKRVCKTLELLWQYNLDEQTFSFKSMMKLTLRRTLVAGAGYVKLGFQRAMTLSPEQETRIADMTARLSTISRLSDDIADREIPDNSAETEQLRLAIQAIMKEPDLIAREGISLDYPDSTSIIPDRNCKSLRGFLGADHVTQEYRLTSVQIQEIYGVDVSKSFRPYGTDGNQNAPGDNDSDRASSRACVWEIYNRPDGLVYVTCDGYPDFLQEPAAPDTYLDRFWPWFPLLLNETYDEENLFPVSDIDLIRDMQLELNRARQGLREHRRANRPKTIAAAGVLEEADKDKLRSHPANALIELNALAPGQKVDEVLQAFKSPPIDPELYDTNETFQDILRVLGQDQASMGQTSSTTATEASVAQSSQHTDLASCLDDQDEMLSDMARAGGKILLMNVSAQTVQKVVGPGAVWPELTKADIIENIYLSVKAGSTGRPNKQQEVMNAQMLFPMLQRIPGINPEWMARELIHRLDDRMDLTEAFVAGMPSMDALNRIQGTVAVPPPQDPSNTAPPPGPAPAGPVPPPPPPPPGGTGAGGPLAPPMGGAPNDPTAQGDHGGRNLPAPPPINGLLGPRQPPVPGTNGLSPGRGGGPALRPQGALPTP